ncbi:hypothetical protein A3E11_01320 [Candidatus Curtissbacteria bacterium RIFCSPHIGHO2_12_FULL_38_37]|nr:MAG: hypothetical protein A3E11_01320 [Candidatus Curtissbacteria bacterium RIFCSPHIGHO2_12_FULL_38_37]
MYDKIISFEALLGAYYRARKCKRYKDKILRFGYYLESNLLLLRRDLQSEYYTPSPYVCFTVHDPKQRKVAAPAFCDRVVQHSLVAAIEPLFEKTFIYDSYACRQKKGTHFGLQRLKKFLQAARSLYGPTAPIYCLRMDISKFFASMSWDVLFPLIFKRVTCLKTQNLITKILTRYRFFDEFGHVYDPAPLVVSPGLRKGLPIGNLTSQLLANIYLNELDHFVKDRLRVRWYGRYMDDFLVIHHDKEELKRLEAEIRTFLKDTLKLTLSDRKVIISNVKDGIPFVGYRIFYDHITIRGSTLLHMQRKLKRKREELRKGYAYQDQLIASVNSLFGHFRHADSWSLKQKMFTLNERYPKKKKHPVKVNLWDEELV